MASSQKSLAFVSAIQLLFSLVGWRKALRERIPFDLPFRRGKPEHLGRDQLIMGTGLSAPAWMLLVQAICTGLLFRGQRPAVSRVLGWFGASYVIGYLLERGARESLRHPSPAMTTFTVGFTAFSAAMGWLGLKAGKLNE